MQQIDLLDQTNEISSNKKKEKDWIEELPVKSEFLII